ncbi:MAG: hypothetical protein N2506_00070 [Dehalococcoidales bacterium]|nr:hypothetical protein [Dehalococcoidales bacterium]
MNSRYEKYIVRKPGVVKAVTGERLVVEVPSGEIPVRSPVDTGPLVIFSDDFLPGATTKVEYGFITGDTEIGMGKGFGAHKHEYPEIFLFLGTDHRDVQSLGAEAEFWLGEGDELEKVKFTTSSSVYVPPGVAHFPLIWRKIRRPVMMAVIVPQGTKYRAIPVKREF